MICGQPAPRSVQVHPAGVNLTCQAPYPPFVHFFAFALHARLKAFVTDVRGALTCARLLFIVVSRGRYMCDILGRCRRSSMTSLHTFVSGIRRLFSASSVCARAVPCARAVTRSPRICVCSMRARRLSATTVFPPPSGPGKRADNSC